MTIRSNEFTREIVFIEGKKYHIYHWDDPDKLVPRLSVLYHKNGRRVQEADQLRLQGIIAKGAFKI